MSEDPVLQVYRLAAVMMEAESRPGGGLPDPIHFKNEAEMEYERLDRPRGNPPPDPQWGFESRDFGSRRSGVRLAK